MLRNWLQRTRPETTTAPPGKPDRDDVALRDHAVAAMAGGLLVVDMAGRIIEINHAAADFLGYDADDLAGQSVLRITPRPYLEEFRLFLEEIERMPIHRLRHIHRRAAALQANGQALPIDLDLAVFETGEERFLAVNFRDASRRANRERLTTQALAVRTAVLDSAAFALISTNAAGIVQLFNSAAERLLGYDADDVIGKATPLLFHDVDEIRRRLEQEFTELPDEANELDALLAHARRRNSSADDWNYVNADGSNVPVFASVQSLLDEEGQLAGYLFVAVDASDERRFKQALLESEHRFKTLFNNAPVGLFLTDEKGNCKLVNWAWSDQTGISNAAARDQGWLAAVHPDDFAEVFEQWQESIATRRPFRREFRFKKPNGETTWVSGETIRLQTESGETAGYLGTTADITDRKNTDRLKNEFISIVSHELRTPLTSINGAIALLASGVSGPLTDEAHDLATIAQSNCDRLICLINDLLDIEKIESGILEESVTRVNIGDIVHEAIVQNRPLETERNVTFRLHDKPENAMVLGDRSRLNQVMTNLLSNASKHGALDDVIDIEVKPGEGRVRVVVTDHGEGVDHHIGKRIFNKFVQGEPSSTRRVGGTGLGLSICKSIIEHLGGDIDFESRPGQTSFYFELPLAEDSDVNNPSPRTGIAS
ncbi:MAG: PAS domain-containing sensor histidine kinase [Gammaproteobacteria bacterium]|nr:PAS domain-containing sensor histidine kinase [Gammaproteobacteria bacterium]